MKRMIKIIYWPSTNKGLVAGDKIIELDQHTTTGRAQLEIGDYQCVILKTEVFSKPVLEFSDGGVKAL